MRRFSYYFLICCMLLNTNPVLLASPLTYSADEEVPEKFLVEITDGDDNLDDLGTACHGLVVASPLGTEVSVSPLADWAHSHESTVPLVFSLHKLRI